MSLHPIATQESLRLENAGEIEVVERPDYFQMLYLSWIFYIVYAAYSLLVLYLGIKAYSGQSDVNDFVNFAFDRVSFQWQKIGLVTLLVNVIFFPIYFYVYLKVWRGLLNFFVKIFGRTDVNENQIEQVILSSQSSHLFYIIPIFGQGIKHFTSIYYLYLGMRRNMQFSNLQSFLVLVTPLFLVLIFTFFLLAYWIFVFYLIFSMS